MCQKVVSSATVNSSNANDMSAMLNLEPFIRSSKVQIPEVNFPNTDTFLLDVLLELTEQRLVSSISRGFGDVG